MTAIIDRSFIYILRQVKQFDEIKRAITSRGIIHGFHVEDPEVFVPEHCDTFETENGLHEIL